MDNSVLVAIITAGLTFLGVLITNRRSTTELFAKLDKQSELSDAKLEREIAVVKTEINNLAAKVDKHNNFAERVPAMEEKLSSHSRRLTELEHKP